MLGRSSRRSGLVAACALAVAAAACGKSAPAKPEADPDEVSKLAARMAREVPTPAAVRDCTTDDLTGGVSMTWRTLVQLGKGKIVQRPEDSEWINPAQLDTPAARTLLEPKDKKLARQAAAELLAAPFWIVYKVDYLNAPMALGVKELKRGVIGTRVIRYEKATSLPSCVLVFNFANDQKISDDAIEVSDKAEIDPAVAKILRDDLVHQYITQAPRGNPPKPAAGTK